MFGLTSDTLDCNPANVVSNEFERQLHIVRIGNMEPWDALFRRISWRVVTGIEGLTQDDHHQGFILRGRPGVNICTRDKRLLGYRLLETEIGAAYADNARLAADPTIGLMASPGEHRRLRLSGGRYRLLDGRYNETQISLKIYF